MIRFLPLYLLSVNLLTLFLFHRDKRLAQLGGRRIPEFRLLLFAALGGAAGAWVGMRVFRHKTRKPLFTILVPLLFFLQLALGIMALLQRLPGGSGL